MWVDIFDVVVCWECFVLFLVVVFLEMVVMNGIIELLLLLFEQMKLVWEVFNYQLLVGQFYLKVDSQLLILGLIKLCGGIYEVFKFVEQVVMVYMDLMYMDDYSVLVMVKYYELFV